MDADGFLVLLDRKKDMIISGGFNVYPSDWRPSCDNIRRSRRRRSSGWRLLVGEKLRLPAWC
jgi:hypothetical protein